MAQALPSGREYWVRADVCCLMCGRRLGHVLGPTEPTARPQPGAGPRLVFAVFRATDPTTPPRRIGPAVRFRCLTCGGQGMLDELQTFSVENEQGAGETPPTRNGQTPELRLLK